MSLLFAGNILTEEEETQLMKAYQIAIIAKKHDQLQLFDKE
jgi:hypothetical protein